MIEVSGTVGYKKHAILHDISLNINPGEGVCLLGPNGSGKSTLLTSTAGILPFLAGGARINGKPVEQPTTKKLIGFLADPPSLYEELTPLEHLELLQKLWPRNMVAKQRIVEVLRLLDIYEIAAQRVSFLSLGQRKRLGIALSILHQPKFLIFDEPLNGLDQEACDIVKTLLESHAKSGGAFLLVTHQPQLLHSVCHRTLHARRTGILKEIPHDESYGASLPEVFENPDPPTAQTPR